MKGKWTGTIDGFTKGRLDLNLYELTEISGGFLVIRDLSKNQFIFKVFIDPPESEHRLNGKLYEYNSKIAEGNERGLLDVEIFENGTELKGKLSDVQGNESSIHLFESEEISAKPPTAFSSNMPLKSCRLGQRELTGLVKLMLRDVDSSIGPIFTATMRGSSYFKIGLNELLEDDELPRTIYSLTISVDNNLSYGSGKKSITVNLNPDDDNRLTVHGDDSTWVNGRASEIRSYLDNYKSKTAFFFQKYGLDLNFIIFIGVIVYLPNVTSLFRRAVLMLVTIIFTTSLRFMYRKIFPRSVIYFGPKEQTFWQREKNGIVAGIITALAVAAISYLASNISDILERISKLFNL